MGPWETPAIPFLLVQGSNVSFEAIRAELMKGILANLGEFLPAKTFCIHAIPKDGHGELEEVLLAITQDMPAKEVKTNYPANLDTKLSQEEFSRKGVTAAYYVLYQNKINFWGQVVQLSKAEISALRLGGNRIGKKRLAVISALAEKRGLVMGSKYPTWKRPEAI